MLKGPHLASQSNFYGGTYSSIRGRIPSQLFLLSSFRLPFQASGIDLNRCSIRVGVVVRILLIAAAIRGKLYRGRYRDKKMTFELSAVFNNLNMLSSSDHSSIVSMNLFVALLCGCIVLGHLLEENRWVNESITALLIGLCTGVVILLVSGGKSSHLLVKKKQFFRNFVTIMMFGALGTLISFVIISVGSLALFKKLDIGSLEISDYLAIGAIFAATDSVCTLQVLNQDETPLLYSLVFGEGVVNDATSVVLFNAIQHFDLSHISAKITMKFIGNFLELFFASTLLGVMTGLLSAYIIRKLYIGRHSTDREVALVILMAYLSYMLAELFYLSGILTVFFCGIVMSHYTWHNVTESSRITTKHAFATLSFVAETFIFLYVGMDALDIDKWRFVHDSPGTLIAVSSILLFLVMLGRAALVFPLSFLSNLTKKAGSQKISIRQQVIIWWAGLMRGAVSMALAYNQFTRSGHTHLRGNAIMITSTISVVLVSTVVFGLLTKPLIRLLLPTSRNNLSTASIASEFDSTKSLVLPFFDVQQECEAEGNQEQLNRVFRPSSLRMLLNSPTHTVHHYWRKFDNAFMRPVFGGRGFVPFVPGSPTERESLNSGVGSPTTRSPSRHARSSSACTALLRKPQNMQAMAAAQRLAKVMAVHSDLATDEDDDDDDVVDLAIHHSSTGLGLSAGRAHGPRPRPSMPAIRAPPSSVGSATSAMSSSQPAISIEQALPTNANASQATRRRASMSMSFTQQSPPEKSPETINPTVEQPSFTLNSLVKRPHVVSRIGALVPPSTTTFLKQPSGQNLGVPAGFRSGRRLSMELVSVDFREPKEHNSADIESQDSSALQDEVDMLQEDNDSLLEKLRLAQKRCEEAEARAKQLEFQVAGLGEGKRQPYRNTTKDDDATSALEQLQECESELRSLRSAVQRLVLTQEEKEEVVLKRCWLARYWGLCVKYGIHPDIARAKHEYWSSWAPLPFEVVVAAGMDAKLDCQSGVNCDLDERESMVRDVNRISGDSNAESMILVDKGLRELASLKIEDAVVFEMGQKRNVHTTSFSELSPEEVEEVQFKLAWLVYFWRRAKRHGLEDDIADERLETWIQQTTHQTTPHLALDVERGMMELRKLGIETSLWEESRSWIQ
ncbi:hypothetical protein V2J09_023073 [Rumex salicifolius]